jgi:tRNA(Ile)-lysidine synthase
VSQDNLTPDEQLLVRFEADLTPLAGPDVKLGIAVSGGPDSLALLLLAAATRHGRIEAATVDHQLREGSGAEAKFVAGICNRLGIPHHTLPVTVGRGASLQSQARSARYDALGEWAITSDLHAVATGHHVDDQAETLLMRMARGAGLGGLVGVRYTRPLEPGVQLIRPLLEWRRAELAAIVAAAGLDPVDDPSNRDPRHDRSRFRGMLAEAEWADAERLAASARWLADADEALDWAVAPLLETRMKRTAAAISIDAEGLPRELQRRLLVTAFDRMGAQRPRGPDLDRARKALRAGKPATLSGLKLEPGPPWRLSVAPPRRRN